MQDRERYGERGRSMSIAEQEEKRGEKREDVGGERRS
jgi:hypothetical protein